MRGLKFLLLLASIHLAPFALSDTTAELLGSSQINENVKKVLLSLVEKNQISRDSQWAKSAVEELKLRNTATENQILTIRQSSELSIDEILAEIPSLNEKARKDRPTTPPEGALYVDVYQESPVLIDYNGDGNVVKEMSFAVTYKYLKDSDGKIVPHFVRAQLVSTGAPGHRTSIGEFSIDSRHRYYVSQTYGSRMDYAQFFIGGIAIHQTPVENYPKLGGPASHGCVRNHEYDADAMWNLIGNDLEDHNFVNIKVYDFGVPVVLADSTDGTGRAGFAGNLNKWLNNSIACDRRDVSSACTKSWEAWD